MTEVTEDALKEVMTGILKNAHNELMAIQTPEELEKKYWFFEWEDEYSIEWNTYQFNDCLDLYKDSCRRWEEVKNGRCCVVERVRDKYLMPKIREFLATLRAKQ